MDQTGILNPRYIKVKEEEKVENFMIDIIMINEIIKMGTDQIVVTGETSINRREVDKGMNLIIEENILGIT